RGRPLPSFPTRRSSDLTTGPPLNTARTTSPPDMVRRAVCDSMSSVPWVMCTPPERMLTESLLKTPDWLPASISSGLLRSDDRPRATAMGSSTHASTIARGSARRRGTGLRWRSWSGDIAGAYLRLEFVALAGQVGFQADAPEYRTGLGDGHCTSGRRQVAVGVDVQLRGVHFHRALFRWARDGDVAEQAQLLAVGCDPAAAGGDVPITAFAVGQQEHRRLHFHVALVGIACHQRGAQRERFLAVVVQCDQFEVVQQVVGAPADAFGHGLRRAMAPHRPPREDGGDEQDEGERGAPAHARTLKGAGPRAGPARRARGRRIRGP